ncbi:MAG: HAD family phosphatase [Actinomycetota bacterium]|nr:HAD family phosphatase [Actinomycetota bacterium]
MSRNKTKIKAVIFDMGKVILKVDHMIACNKFSRYCHLGPEEIYNRIIGSELEDALERGFINPDTFYKAISEKLGINLAFNRFDTIFSDVFSYNDGMAEIIDDLKQRVEVLLLSNTNLLHFRWVEKKFRVLKKFDNRVLSFKVGFRKPEPEIYLNALDILKFMPEETIYIDDIEEYVEGARKLGINGIVFKCLDFFKSELLKYYLWLLYLSKLILIYVY